jgi:hypothetical protein
VEWVEREHLRDRVDVSGWLQRPEDVVEYAADAVPEESAVRVRRARRLAEGWLRVWAWETEEAYRQGQAPVSVALCLAQVAAVWTVETGKPGAVLAGIWCAGLRWYVAMTRDDVLLVMGLLT